jgi:GMP synthase (glutamine-hydrolysing)
MVKMAESLRFLIVDGYPKASREEFERIGMTPAGRLYAALLLQHLPQAAYDIIYASDPGVELPDKENLTKYQAILWPGCNLTVYHQDDERVTRMVNLVQRGYELGIPQFGSCWGVQIAVYAAGGEVKKNPRGREMGVARKIHLTSEGMKHPMFEGKPLVFNGFISHDDEVTQLPKGSQLLATNDFSKVQAVAVEYKKGIFWAVQYHPEYNLHEMARLIVAREEKLTREGYFRNHKEMEKYVGDLEMIAADPSRKDLRWQLDIDDDLLSDEIRQCEFVNWLNKIVLAK